MAHKTFHQTHRRTYNPFTNFTVNETSHGKSITTRIVIDNDGREIHLGRTSHEDRRHQDEQKPPIGDTRGIIRAIRDRVNTQKRSENTIVHDKRLEQEVNRMSSDAERVGSDTRRRETGRIRDKAIQKWMKELEYLEKELERRRIQENLGRRTPPLDQSHNHRSPSRSRSPRRRRSRSKDRHHHRALGEPSGRSPLRGDTQRHGRYYHVNNGGDSGKRDYGGDDDNYHRRHNDCARRSNNDYRMGYNNNQHDEETLLREQLEKLEKRSDKLIPRLGTCKLMIMDVMPIGNT